MNNSVRENVIRPIYPKDEDSENDRHNYHTRTVNYQTSTRSFLPSLPYSSSQFGYRLPLNQTDIENQNEYNYYILNVPVNGKKMTKEEHTETLRQLKINNRELYNNLIQKAKEQKIIKTSLSALPSLPVLSWISLFPNYPVTQVFPTPDVRYFDVPIVDNTKNIKPSTRDASMMTAKEELRYATQAIIEEDKSESVTLNNKDFKQEQVRLLDQSDLEPFSPIATENVGNEGFLPSNTDPSIDPKKNLLNFPIENQLTGETEEITTPLDPTLTDKSHEIKTSIIPEEVISEVQNPLVISDSFSLENNDDQQVEGLKNQLAAITNIISETIAQKETLERNHQEYLEYLEKKMDESKKLLKEARNNIESLSNQNETLMKRIEDLENQIRLSIVEIGGIEIDHQKKINYFERRIKELTAQQNIFIAQIEIITQENNELKTKKIPTKNKDVGVMTNNSNMSRDTQTEPTEYHSKKIEDNDLVEEQYTTHFWTEKSDKNSRIDIPTQRMVENDLIAQELKFHESKAGLNGRSFRPSTINPRGIPLSRLGFSEDYLNLHNISTYNDFKHYPHTNQVISIFDSLENIGSADFFENIFRLPHPIAQYYAQLIQNNPQTRIFTIDNGGSTTLQARFYHEEESGNHQMTYNLHDAQHTIDDLRKLLAEQKENYNVKYKHRSPTLLVTPNDTSHRHQTQSFITVDDSSNSNTNQPRKYRIINGDQYYNRQSKRIVNPTTYRQSQSRITGDDLNGNHSSNNQYRTPHGLSSGEPLVVETNQGDEKMSQVSLNNRESNHSTYISAAKFNLNNHSSDIALSTKDNSVGSDSYQGAYLEPLPLQEEHHYETIIVDNDHQYSRRNSFSNDPFAPMTQQQYINVDNSNSKPYKSIIRKRNEPTRGAYESATTEENYNRFYQPSYQYPPALAPVSSDYHISQLQHPDNYISTEQQLKTSSNDDQKYRIESTIIAQEAPLNYRDQPRRNSSTRIRTWEQLLDSSEKSSGKHEK